MAKEWSERILIADLADEPALSDELHALNERLAEPESDGARDVVLNFAAVTYVNSSNIAQLLRLRSALADRGRGLRLCSIRDPVWSVLLMTGLDKVFNFAPDPASAIASLQLDGTDGRQGAAH